MRRASAAPRGGGRSERRRAPGRGGVVGLRPRRRDGRSCSATASPSGAGRARRCGRSPWSTSAAATARGARARATSRVGAAIGSEAFAVSRVDRQDLPRGGVRLTMTLTGVPGMTVKRIAEAYPGVAGFRTQTIVEPVAGLAIDHAVLEEAAPGARHAGAPRAARRRGLARPRSGRGPSCSSAIRTPGTWRETTTGGPRPGGQRERAVGERRRR